MAKIAVVQHAPVLHEEHWISLVIMPPDIFKLHVNTSSQSPVQFNSGE